MFYSDNSYVMLEVNMFVQVDLYLLEWLDEQGAVLMVAHNNTLSHNFFSSALMIKRKDRYKIIYLYAE